MTKQRKKRQKRLTAADQGFRCKNDMQCGFAGLHLYIHNDDNSQPPVKLYCEECRRTVAKAVDEWKQSISGEIFLFFFF